MNESHIVEFFSSIQGEGLLVGCRQIFVRFSGCNITCDYCDTAHESPLNCQLETTPGKRDFVAVANPISINIINEHLEGWHSSWPSLHHSLSLTGGEPLMHVEFLSQWLPFARKYLPVYLETNGTLCNALANLLGCIDYVCMDIKLPSTSGLDGFWSDHETFLKLASTKNVFVKCVVSDNTGFTEIDKACSIIASIDQSIPLILQPVTLRNGTIGITNAHLFLLQENATRCLHDVRIIPQVHRFIGIM